MTSLSLQAKKTPTPYINITPHTLYVKCTRGRAILNTKECTTLYEKFNTCEAVARITHLDRRTVKRYIDYEK